MLCYAPVDSILFFLTETTKSCSQVKSKFILAEFICVLNSTNSTVMLMIVVNQQCVFDLLM